MLEAPPIPAVTEFSLAHGDTFRFGEFILSPVQVSTTHETPARRPVGTITLTSGEEAWVYIDYSQQVPGGFAHLEAKFDALYIQGLIPIHV